MVELYSKKKIVTDHMFDVNFRGNIIGINTFSVTFMSHGSETVQCTIIVLDPTNPDIRSVKTVTVLLSYSDAKVAQKDMEAFINGVWNNNVTVFDPKPEEIKYVPGKRPLEDISLIKSSAYHVISLKDRCTYVYFVNDMDMNEDGERSPYGFSKTFRTTKPVYHSTIFEDYDMLPVYQEEQIIQEILGDVEIVMGDFSINEVVSYAVRYPKEVVDSFYIVDGKISRAGELEVDNKKDDEEKK